MSHHNDSNASHLVADGIAHSSTMLFFFSALVLLFYAPSNSELQGVRAREDMTALVRTNLLHPIFSSPETSPTQ